MKNRPIIIRLRKFTASLLWPQLKNLTKQQVIDNISPSLNASELVDLDKWGPVGIEWLKGEWKRQEKIDIVSDHMRQQRLNERAAEKVRVTDWLITNKGLSTDTANTLYEDCNTMLEAE